MPGRLHAGNPVGLPADATVAEFAAAVDVVSADPGIDAVIAIYTSPLPDPLQDVAAAIADAAALHPTTPLVACVLGRRGLLDAGPGRPTVPSFAFPEAAGRALGAVAAYAAWRRRGPGTPVGDGSGAPDGARAAVTRRLASGEGWLGPRDVAELLAAYGLALLRSVLVASAGEATEAAGQIGWPVVLRADARPGSGPVTGAHVRVGLADASAVETAWEALHGPDVDVVVQAMATPGLDVVVGIEQDPLFGSLVTLGRSAGTGVAPRRRSARSTPLTDVDVEAVLDDTDDGWSDAERHGVAGVVARIGCLADDLPEVVELELNPVIVGAGGAVATGARVRVAPYEPRPEMALRRLV
jgi:acyl-CoA synthetase (NDP forming)